MLMDFLSDKNELVIWILTQAGMFQGKLAYYNDEYLEFGGAFYFNGCKCIYIKYATILIDKIIGWGEDDIQLSEL